MTGEGVMGMSIFPLFLLLLVGVSVSRYVNFDESEVLQPIVTLSRQRKICAELCTSGLGGPSCGNDCVDLIPQGLPVQSVQANKTAKYGVNTRHSSCDILCENGLGYPLCECEPKQSALADFFQICSFFCLEYDYRLYGCQKCSLFNATVSNTDDFSARSLVATQKQTVDWDIWCQKMCSTGDGGGACNCDLLPMSLQL